MDMLAYLSMGPNGEMYINEGTYSDGNLIVELPASVCIGLDLFVEETDDFSYQRDCDRMLTLLRWLLENKGYEDTNARDFDHAVSNLCTPGGMQHGGYVIGLTRLT